MCQTVRFSDGVEKLLQINDSILLEVGPGQSLSSLVKLHPNCDSAKGQFIFPTLRSQYERQPDESFLLDTLARLWLAALRRLETVSMPLKTARVIAADVSV